MENEMEFRSETEDLPMPDVTTLEMTDSNDITFPSEWGLYAGFNSGFVQITLIDDKIAIHKPTAADVEYTKPCKAGDNSYIRTMGLFDVRVPKQFFEALGIKSGDKIDLTREENCISIRKNTDDASELPEAQMPGPPDPIMAFCCICGTLLYTENLVKLPTKYICHSCIDVVKAL